MKERNQTRKEWLKNLKTQILELKNLDKSDREIKSQIKKEFSSHLGFGERVVQIVFIILWIFFVLLGVHISYTILLWEANIYTHSGIGSPYLSMILFGLVCVLLFGVFSFWFGFFVDWFRYNKILNDSLDENFYLKLLKAILILACLGFVIFMLMVFVVAWQISEFYGMPLARSLFETLMEIFD